MVVAQVMKAEEHLPPGAAVEEEGGGPALGRWCVLRQEELAVNGRSVGGCEDDLARLGEARGQVGLLFGHQPLPFG